MSTEQLSYQRGYNAGRRDTAARTAIPADQEAAEPTYECKTCGTKWLGSKLLPVWSANGKECTGSMERVAPAPRESTE